MLPVKLIKPREMLEVDLHSFPNTSESDSERIIRHIYLTYGVSSFICVGVGGIRAIQGHGIGASFSVFEKGIGRVHIDGPSSRQGSAARVGARTHAMLSELRGPWAT